MKTFWIFNVVIVALFLVATFVFYRMQFTTEGLVYFISAAVILGVLSTINRRMNYKKSN
ncbi:hypothetical protein RYX56_06700 [Alkalihalophilus lindianensis]|uniref:Uncharacterized protein n=1 Tax=Alkalihalophilus lindianensis TaxID=1630542 RepID=A0ABU3X839_9BACI|nr:hypothetical protein [Alkalihalophilus lindianensis]MDV2684057.1 hypothetical protein [Alkalihalophilus lindianensis]